MQTFIRKLIFNWCFIVLFHENLQNNSSKAIFKPNDLHDDESFRFSREKKEREKEKEEDLVEEMRRKRLEVKVSFEWVFLEPSIISTIRMGWELARWPSLSPGVEWTALNAMTSFSTSFPVPGAASYPSSVPLTRNFSWIEGRSFIPSHSTGYEWIFRIRVFLPHEKYPSSDFSRPRWTVRENVGFGEYPQTFCKIYPCLWMEFSSKKKKKKNISYLHFVWTMHYSKYGSIVILLRRNVL